MSPELYILRDLLAGPSTADSMPARVKLSEVETIAHLVTLKREGKVESRPIGGLKNVHAFRLTDAGRQFLLKP